MPRRALSLTLLILVAVQLLGAVAFASVCLEPCPDDTGEGNCPPVCSLCTTCTHARQAILHSGTDDVAVIRERHVFPPQVFSASSLLASDIFHVPLFG